jgi:L-idonate 5-dehydrogenase
MLACRIHAKDDLRVEAQDMPAVGAGEVLLKLGAGGICGSDLHYYFEGRNGNFVVREPLIPGHEASAVVAAIGDGVTRVNVGDKVAVSPSHACGHCGYCREGREQLCDQMRFLGSASRFPHIQGMFREYFVMGERQCYPVTGDVSRLGEIASPCRLPVGAARGHTAAAICSESRCLITGARHDRLRNGARGALAGLRRGDRSATSRSAARAGSHCRGDGRCTRTRPADAVRLPPVRRSPTRCRAASPR